MKILLMFCLVTPFAFQLAFAEQLDLFTDNQIYSPNKPLFVYGKALPNEDVVLRITSLDDNTIITFTQTTTDENGDFQMKLFEWPESSTSFPYGTYVVEAISTEQGGLSKKIDIKFAPTTDTEKIPISQS